MQDPTLQAWKQQLQASGWRITSEGRSRAHNARVGGVPNSYHVEGRALDVWHDDPRQRRALVQAVNATGRYEAIDEGDHIHIEPRGRR